MNLNGNWTITEEWGGGDPYNFNVTFNPDGIVTIDGPAGGFAMVWYNDQQSGPQGVVLAGDNRIQGILAAYYGTMKPGGQSMSGSANGKMGDTPVSGTWSAVPTN